MEAGREDHHIHRPLAAVGGDDAGRGEPRDAVGDHLGLRVCDAAVVGVGVEDALATRPVVGGELAAQLAILDRATDVPLAHQLTEFEQARLLGHRETDRFVDPVDAGAHRCSGARHVGKHPLHPLGDRVVGPGHHPGGGALVELQAGDVFDDLGHDLDRAGAGADHRDTLAGDVDVVVPLRRVERRAVAGQVVVEAVELGDQRDVQSAGTGDQELCDELAAVVGEHVPALLVVVPLGPVDVRTEPDVAAQPVLLGDPEEIVLDLGLERPHVRPVRFRFEGE